MFDFIRRIISSGAPITDVNILTGSSDDDKLLAKISERVIIIVPAKPLEMYVRRSFLSREAESGNMWGYKTDKTYETGYTYY